MAGCRDFACFIRPKPNVGSSAETAFFYVKKVGNFSKIGACKYVDPTYNIYRNDIFNGGERGVRIVRSGRADDR
ncbi:hypothetical protein J21TS7_50270 [Paenibacillus cineris]|uniref:Uncharacterized protein n=1 Tax=Paenibacillus cineris TaxID=237530 RepID=A0ABQ4LJK4_9BACL|nr:hypothetical protein J21TS7_50270 [Paenibacillus cineris]